MQSLSSDGQITESKQTNSVLLAPSTLVTNHIHSVALGSISPHRPSFPVSPELLDSVQGPELVNVPLKVGRNF